MIRTLAKYKDRFLVEAEHLGIAIIFSEPDEFGQVDVSFYIETPESAPEKQRLLLGGMGGSAGDVTINGPDGSLHFITLHNAPDVVEAFWYSKRERQL